MKLDEMIEKLKDIQLKHGNLDVFSDDYYNISVWLEDSLEEELEFPAEWNMPEKFVRIVNLS